MKLNKIWQLAITSTVTVVLLCASALASYPPSEHEAAIKAEIQRFADAWNRNDLKTIKDLYAEEANLLPDGAETVVGREAVIPFLQKLRTANWPDKVTFPNIEVFGNGQIVTATSDIEFRDQKNALKGNGKQMLIFVKQGDRWKLLRDTYTDNGATKP